MNQTWLIGIITGVQALLFLIFKTTYAGAVKSKFDESLEGVKAGFTKDVEKLKSDLTLNVNTEVAKLQASLSKVNISHQIVTSEYTKYKFDKVAQLNKAILDLLKQHFKVDVLFRQTIKSEAEGQSALDDFLPLRNNLSYVISETSLFIDTNLEKEIMSYERLSKNVINHLVVLGTNQVKILSLEEENNALNDNVVKDLRTELKGNLDKLEELRIKLLEGYESIKLKLKVELKAC